MQNEERTEYIKTRSMKENERVFQERPKRQYSHISKEKKQQLINTVLKQGCRIKRIARDLGINYATAKTILHAFKKQSFSLEKNNQNRQVGLAEFKDNSKMQVVVSNNGLITHQYEYYQALRNK